MLMYTSSSTRSHVKSMNLKEKNSLVFQCYTHQYLGWKINVVDDTDMTSKMLMGGTDMTSEIPIGGTDKTTENPMGNASSISATHILIMLVSMVTALYITA